MTRDREAVAQDIHKRVSRRIERFQSNNKSADRVAAEILQMIALTRTPPASEPSEAEVSPADDEETRAFVAGWNAAGKGGDFDMALHWWSRERCGI